MPGVGIPTIAEASKQIAAKQLSPVELTRACLDRVGALDDRLHAFVHLTEERALAEAHEAERAIMAGGPNGPLHGIPIGLKDRSEEHTSELQSHSFISDPVFCLKKIETSQRVI